MKEQNNSHNSDANNRLTPIEWMRWIPAALLAIAFLVFVVVSGRIVLVPMLISVALAYLLAPIVRWFERRGWSRSYSTLLGITAATLLVVLVLIFVIPSVWNQLNKSYGQAQALLQDNDRLEQLLTRIKQINPQLSDLVKEQIQKSGGNIDVGKILGWVGKWLQTGLFKLVDLTASILDLLLIPFFIYYLLADYRDMRDRVDRLIPPRFRNVTTDLMAQINEVLSSYVRNQLLIAVAMGAMYSAGFMALRVPLGFTIGMLSGLLNFVPYLGTLIGFGLSLFFVALDGAGIGRISGVLVVFAVVQSVEGYYLTPKLLGSRLNLHPMWVLVGLVIGGNLFGLLGIILAVPVIAVAKVVLGVLEEIYQESNFYRRTGTTLLTGQGQVVGLSESGSPTTGLIVQEEISDRPRRTIITTSELKSRIRDERSQPKE
ncbi:MAG: AI-2E family transporter [Acidobacteriota bacterium]|nr:AI-2E family transporter [Acidobacteriota bacterium]